jgi:general stress protein YciG
MLPFHRADSATYLPQTNQVGIHLTNDVEIRFPITKLEGLENATPEQLADVRIEGTGTGLTWPQLDVAHDIPSLVDGLFGTRRYFQEIGRAGGSATSPTKSEASRENGTKGGRPTLDLNPSGPVRALGVRASARQIAAGEAPQRPFNRVFQSERIYRNWKAKKAEEGKGILVTSLTDLGGRVLVP